MTMAQRCSSPGAAGQRELLGLRPAPDIPQIGMDVFVVAALRMPILAHDDHWHTLGR